jgi:hypothetical protein
MPIVWPEVPFSAANERKNLRILVFLRDQYSTEQILSFPPIARSEVPIPESSMSESIGVDRRVLQKKNIVNKIINSILYANRTLLFNNISQTKKRPRAVWPIYIKAQVFELLEKLIRFIVKHILLYEKSQFRDHSILRFFFIFHHICHSTLWYVHSSKNKKT